MFDRAIYLVKKEHDSLVLRIVWNSIMAKFTLLMQAFFNHSWEQTLLLH